MWLVIKLVSGTTTFHAYPEHICSTYSLEDSLGPFNSAQSAILANISYLICFVQNGFKGKHFEQQFRACPLPADTLGLQREGGSWDSSVESVRMRHSAVHGPVSELHAPCLSPIPPHLWWDSLLWGLMSLLFIQPFPLFYSVQTWWEQHKHKMYFFLGEWFAFFKNH